jgi:hypothetical protein
MKQFIFAISNRSFLLVESFPLYVVYWFREDDKPEFTQSRSFNLSLHCRVQEVLLRCEQEKDEAWPPRVENVLSHTSRSRPLLF